MWRGASHGLLLLTLPVLVDAQTATSSYLTTAPVARTGNNDADISWSMEDDERPILTIRWPWCSNNQNRAHNACLQDKIDRMWDAFRNKHEEMGDRYDSDAFCECFVDKCSNNGRRMNAVCNLLMKGLESVPYTNDLDKKFVDFGEGWWDEMRPSKCYDDEMIEIAQCMHDKLPTTAMLAGGMIVLQDILSIAYQRTSSKFDSCECFNYACLHDEMASCRNILGGSYIQYLWFAHGDYEKLFLPSIELILGLSIGLTCLATLLFVACCWLVCRTCRTRSSGREVRTAESRQSDTSMVQVVGQQPPQMPMMQPMQMMAMQQIPKLPQPEYNNADVPYAQPQMMMQPEMQPMMQMQPMMMPMDPNQMHMMQPPMMQPPMMQQPMMQQPMMAQPQPL
eukprot:GEMP01056709.1.p1 GENE.GEMP01056709.1~~GEMP01056709.1.p1  ORF type:complete len:394 (+),score=77.17 GEMP01056709.1:115-1296(+)